LPVFLAKKEVFQWLKAGEKTIDVRKGNLRKGQSATFICGRYRLMFQIEKTETGSLEEVIRQDNFKEVIPTARVLQDALDYLMGIYGSCDGTFTAYYVLPLAISEK
jgi:ASC-1-like (ASCH) protein